MTRNNGSPEMLLQKFIVISVSGDLRLFVSSGVTDNPFLACNRWARPKNRECVLISVDCQTLVKACMGISIHRLLIKLLTK